MGAWHDPCGGLASTVFLSAVAQGIGVVGMLLVGRRYGGRGLDEPPPATDAPGAGAGGLLAVAQLDHLAFGADRSALLRQVLTFAERLIVTAGGYAATWHNLGIVHAGPLVADSMGTAKALLDVVLPAHVTTGATAT